MILAVGSTPITREGARAAADRELSKGIYHRYDDPWPVRVFNAVQHWVQRFLGRTGGDQDALTFQIPLRIQLFEHDFGNPLRIS